ncbi:midasin-like, partial [Saccostrea cucullata]|uniref:midasin-like n=1 Tax=Saccostrea cuccullata TaxID=36930 RepID=UPI002ED49DB1
MKAFQAVLEQPVQGILADPDSSIDSTGQRERTLTWRETYSSAVQSLISHTVSLQTQQSELPALDRGGLHSRLVTKKLKYDQLIVRLDEFTGEIIESIHELQQLEVSQTDDKEKQKSEAKHIGQKKRKALSDLFKEIAQLGLSYRRGLLCDAESNLPLLVPPLDVSVCSDQLTTSENSATEIGQSCHDYYYKCVARRAKLATALQTPSKELGVGNIERCKGFTEHLMKLVVDQYSGVVEIHKAFLSLSSLSEVLQDLCSVNGTPPPQKSTRERVESLLSLLVSMKEGLIQVKVILRQQEEITHYPSPFPRNQLSQSALMKYGDEQWKHCFDEIQTIQQKANTLYDCIMPLTKRHLITWSDLEKVRSVYGDLTDCVPQLSEIEGHFCDPEDRTLPSYIATVRYLRQGIQSRAGEFTHWVNMESERHVTRSDKEEIQSSGIEPLSDNSGEKMKVETFSDRVENLIAGLLLSVQDLTQNHKQSTAGVKEEDTGTLLEGHLVVHLDERLKGDKKCLQLKKIIQSLQSLVRDVLDLTDTRSDVLTFVQILGQCQPLVQQYRDMVEYYLLHSLAENRVTGKLLSVLLAVFTELASK